MGLREVKKALKELDNETLIKHISELYKKHKPVKDYFDFFLDADEATLVDVYKHQVSQGVCPSLGDRLNLSYARKAISEFKKLGTSAESVADLLLHFAEEGIEYTNTYGPIDEPFYNSIEDNYFKALKLLKKNELLDKFKKRTYEVVTSTKDIGWGFHEDISEIYFEFYETKPT